MILCSIPMFEKKTLVLYKLNADFSIVFHDFWDLFMLPYLTFIILLESHYGFRIWFCFIFFVLFFVSENFIIMAIGTILCLCSYCYYGCVVCIVYCVLCGCVYWTSYGFEGQFKYSVDCSIFFALCFRNLRYFLMLMFHFFPIFLFFFH